MARTRTLAELRADVRFRADAENMAARHPDAKVNRLINESWQALRELVSEAGSEYFLRYETGATGVGTVDAFVSFGVIDYPANAARIYGVDVRVDGELRTLRPLGHNERNDFQEDGGPAGIPEGFWVFDVGAESGGTVVTGKIAIVPAPDQSYDYACWYLPAWTDVADDSHVFNGVAGWEDFVVWDAVVKLTARDNDSRRTYQIAERERAAALERLKAGASRIMRGQAKTRVDTRARRERDRLRRGSGVGVPAGGGVGLTSALRTKLVEAFRSVREDGAVPDTGEDQSVAFQATVDAVYAAGGGEVFVPVGSYNVPTLELKPNVTIRGAGRGTRILNARWIADGTVGDEIEITAAVARGATTIPLDTTGLADGDWIRLASCINANSPDAGADQLGQVVDQHSYLAEFARIETVDASSVDLFAPTIWPYSDTPGSDTDEDFTSSVAHKVNWHEGGRIQGLHFVGKKSGEFFTLRLQWCRDFVIDDCFFDADDEDVQSVRIDYSYDCHIRNTGFINKLTDVVLGSEQSAVIIASSQNCTTDNCTFERGRQGPDVTYRISDALRGGPSISCGGSNCRAINCANHGFTDHPGSYDSFWINCQAIGSPVGFRIRSRGTRLIGCSAISRTTSGSGIIVMGAAALDSVVSGNFVQGHQYGIEFIPEEYYTDLRALLSGSVCKIVDNTVRDSADHGIICNTSPEVAAMGGPEIRGNRVDSPGTHGIYVRSYNNGTIVEGNRIYNIGSGNYGVRWDLNVKRLYVGPNHVYGVHASGVAVGGSGNSTFLTDTTTFPTGNAEGELFVSHQFTDAATPFQNIIRDHTAYVQPKAAGWHPFVSGVGGSAPTLERSSLGIYSDGVMLNMVATDTAGTPRTHRIVLSGDSAPEGSVTAPAGSLFSRTTGQLYIKASGSGDTGWSELAKLEPLVYAAASELTIAGGVVTATGNVHTVDTESDDATDDLDTIEGGASGQVLVISPASSARTVVVKDGTGNLAIAGDFSMDSASDRLTLIKSGSNWFEIARSDNAS